MTVRIAINGYGRIGRLVHRSILEMDRDDIELVAINTNGGAEAIAHLLKWDSVHGPFRGDVKVAGSDNLVVNGKSVRLSSHREPANANWGGVDVDVVMECTGIFRDASSARGHLDAGARKVLISAPGKNVDRTIVYGVNHDTLKADDMIVSNASCTTNCLAPVAKVLHDAFGIEQGFMTTVHAYTGDQKILDNNHKDPRRGRAAALSLVPTSTGAARAVGLVLPELKGRLEGTAVRVPTPNVSLIDLTVRTEKETTVDDIHDAVKKAADGPMKGVLATNEEPLVSVDFNHHPASSIFDLTQTSIIDGRFVRVLAWYDNEWGFSVRMCDTAVAMMKA